MIGKNSHTYHYFDAHYELDVFECSFGGRKNVLIIMALLSLWSGNITAEPNSGLFDSNQTAEEFRYKSQLLVVLVKQAPKLLETYDASTGRFGKGIWISSDQKPIYPLSVIYGYKDSSNPYYKDKKLLEVVMKGGEVFKNIL